MSNYLTLTGNRGEVEFTMFDDKDVLIELDEYNDRCTICIIEEQAKQLRDFLNEHYGE